MATIASLVVKVQADVADVQRNVAKVQTTLGGLEKTVGSVSRALVGMVSVAAVTRAVSQYTQFASRINDLSAKAGMGVESFQRLSYAAKINGGSMEAVAQGAARLARNLVEGQKSTVSAVGALGLKMSDLQRMDPAEAFMTIGDAIARLPNPMQQAAVAMQLFGREGANYLPMFKGHLRDAADEADRLGLVLTRDVIEAADQFGDTLDAVKLVGMAVLSKVITPMMPALTALAQGFTGVGSVIEWLQRAFSNALAYGASFVATMLRASAAVLEFQSHLPGRGSDAALARTMRDHAQYLSDAATMQRTMEWTTRGTTSAHRALAPAIVTTGAALDRTRTKTATAAASYDALTASVMRAAEASALLASAQAGSIEWLASGGGVWMPSTPWGSGIPRGRLIGAEPSSGYLGGGGIPSQFTRPDLLNTPPGRTSIFSGLFDLSDLGPTILSALTGGGSVGRSLGGLLGGKLFSGIGQNVGGIVGSIIPGAGTLLGGLIGGGIGSLFGGLFGKSQGKILGEQADAGIQQLKDQLEAMGWTLDALRERGGAAGQALADAWGDKNVAGLEHFQGLVDQFKESLDIQAEIDSLNGQLAALQAQQVPTWDQVRAAAERYGMTIGGMGQKIQQLYITDAATQIINDWETLTAAGMSASAVARGMKDQLNQLVQDSIKYGSALPANMKPVIESLIAQGLLFDAAGNKITDISQIKWGDPVESEADKINKAIQALIAQIEALVKKLAGVDGTTVDVGVNYHAEDFPPPHGTPSSNPDYGFAGGFVTPHGIQYLATGNVVRPLMWHAMGSDTVPAMLTPGEGVLSRRGMQALGALNSGQVAVGSDNREVVRELRRVGQRLDDLPYVMSRAVRDAVLLTGTR